MKRYSILIMLIWGLVACQRQPQQSTPVINKFSDPVIQEIYTLKDKRHSAGLLPYLHHEKTIYKQEAALAFASVQDTLAIPRLLPLLSDSATAVRHAAAYALGQIGHSKAEPELIQHLTKEQNPVVKAELLQAIGKVATPAGAQYLANYNVAHPTALSGQCWGLYRIGLQQLHTPEIIEKTVAILASAATYEARLAAAHFLARTPGIDLTAYRQQLLPVATSDASAEIRMAVVQAFSKVRAVYKASLLTSLATSDPDYRVRINAIRSMSGLYFNQIEPAILSGLQDTNINVAVATAEFLQANPNGANLVKLQQVLHKTQDARVRGNLIWVILRNSERKEFLSNRYRQQYQHAVYLYDKAHLLKALSADFSNYDFIAQEMFSAQDPVLSTAAMEAFILMRQLRDFPKELEQEFAQIFKRAVGSGDVALAGMAASAIRTPKLNLRNMYNNDYSFILHAQQKLVLPREIETYNELQQTIDYLQGTTTSSAPQTTYTHPINWDLIKKIPVNQQVLIRTIKGDITLQLFVEEAPSTVANFVELVTIGFYNGLYFHRVVPNFVVQGGDLRGDGWGSSDYNVRSEFSPQLHFREGYIGMASAGKDTETNQWFITHAPAPHLDGRYTVFAKVVSGMDVVHQLEVGDVILSMEVK